MGMFTSVEPDQAILPPEYRQLSGWQTKDVVEPLLETLEITADGQLIHVWQEYEMVADNTAPFGFCAHPLQTHRERLAYHGDMRFYTLDSDDPDNPERTLVELIARFTEGQLQWVKQAPVGGQATG
ncbi:MAG TPA: hypothetical protein PLD25_30420 [Chloroflexota bacterium]|nr:hypothetical protein [Chloroflexota bacterium]HUM71094.1 hypothetical protein [Chloroflexota bacterium]